MRTLDRSLFQQKIPLAAARVLDDRHISKCRSDLTKDMLKIPRVSPVRTDQEGGLSSSGRKSLLLRPEIREDDASTWSPSLKELVEAKKVTVAPYHLELEYDDWTYSDDIISSILPEEEQEELPSGFTMVGHVAHLNLRESYLPYKTLLATVLMDKNPHIRTVINKVDEVGTQSEYRTFNYELLAGDPNLNVEAREQNCVFHFDYSKVYWNSRLNTEHTRLVGIFRTGDAVCDVMAGVGPFAVPAGKKEVFVWANDLNPDSYSSLKDAIKRNNVSKCVQPSNQDGRAFIRSSAQQLLTTRTTMNLRQIRKPVRSPISSQRIPTPPPPTLLTAPKTFTHYILNLPATALTFLPAFIGLYRTHESLFYPHTDIKLPLIHVYCFSTKSDGNVEEKVKICKELSRYLEYVIKPEDPEVEICDVRDVAPQKRMFCASFRLPAEVAFR
ncbi:tRNA(m(1)G37)methyltransferase [Toensbergia leucococca]|nr:tRNA(m(1)G37)methyltransferase [Toensbergia leucococca]